MIDRDWIQAHIPHQGSMCLLHAVQRWDAAGIVCHAVSHRDLDNPLRNASGLPTIAGIEYAAQAMAVHGALLAAVDRPPVVGYLTNVRNVQWAVARLDLLDAPLCVEATRISGNEMSLLYDFSIQCQSQTLLRGRAGVMINPPAVPPGPAASATP